MFPTAKIALLLPSLCAGLLVAWTAPQTVAAKTSCRHDGAEPIVSLSVNPGKVRLHNGHSRSHLKYLQSKRKARSALGSQWQPVGLTLTELQFSLRIRVNAIPTSRGRFCGQLDTVEATLGYDKLTVYVARKYRPGSCHYRSILDHENLHVAVFRDTLRKYAPRVEHRLRRAVRQMRPVLANSADRAATRMRQNLQREIKPLFRQMNREMDLRNDRLDTPQNYRQEQARCSNW